MVMRDGEQVRALLAGGRARMVEVVQRPHSAAGLARELGMKRQQVNYHLRELEKVGLAELVEGRKKGNCVERVLRATARSYVISPEVLGQLGDAPRGLRDRFSSAYLLAVSGRTIRELGRLRDAAKADGKKLATLTLDSEVRFASAAQRNAFAKELTDALARLIVKYHDSETPGGRSFRVTLGAYPALQENTEEQLEKGDLV